MQQQHALCTVEGIKATAFLEEPILEGRNTKVFLLLLGRSIAAVHPSYTTTIKSTTSKNFSSLSLMLTPYYVIYYSNPIVSK